jgi:hypothetical protein
MLNLNGVPFTPEDVELIEASINNYRRFAKISVDTEPIGDTLNVVIKQFGEPSNGKILSNHELLDRAEAIFKPIMPQGFIYVITPVTLDR